MIDNPKEKNSGIEGIQDVVDKSTHKPESKLRLLLVNSHMFIPLGAGIFQILVGFTLIATSLMGLIRPVWLSAILSITGSLSSMVGVFLVYHVFSTIGTFESLINQAIRRVIRSQN